MDPSKFRNSAVKLRLSHAKVQGVNYLRSMVRDKSDISYRKRGYVAFVPNLLVRMLDVCNSNPSSSSALAGEYEVSSELRYQHGIVFFADISGFTKLTEKLAAQPNGAEILCAELDKVYALILSEVDRWGGDCIKFAGDAILFCWPVDSMEGTPEYVDEYKACAIRAVKCSLLIHEKVKSHPEVAGVKLTLHAGMGCGKLAACLLGGGGKPKRRYEFVIAGEPMAQIAKSEPAAKPGETVISTEIVELVNELVVGEEISDGSSAQGYWKLRSMKPEGSVTPEIQSLIDTPPPQSLTVQTLETLDEKLLHRLAMFIPEYILKMLDDHTRVSHAPPERKKSNDNIGELAPEISPAQLQEQLQLSSKSLSEMREATTLFVKLFGVDLSGPIDASQAVFRCIQDAVYAYGGSINKLLVDDKGTLVLIVFGLPPLVHQDSATRAIAAAFLMLKLLKRVNNKQRLPLFKLKSRKSKASYINFKEIRTNSGESSPTASGEFGSMISQGSYEDITAHIGITSARTFCGTIGSEDRREFTVMGDSVNLAARLMAACSQIEKHGDFDSSVVSCAEVVKPVEEGDKEVAEVVAAAVAESESFNESGFGGDWVDTWRPLVLVDKATAEASARSVQFSKFDPIYVKGKSKPVSIFHPTRFFESKNGIINHDVSNSNALPKDTVDDKYIIGEGSQKAIELIDSVVQKIAMNPNLITSINSNNSFDFAQEDDEGNDQFAPTVMVISGEQGNGIHSIARSLVDICPRHNVVLACSTPSTTTHNLLEEGEVKLATVFTAMRGPLLSILQTLINSGLIPGYDKYSVEEAPSSPGQFMLGAGAKKMSFMSKATSLDYTSEVNVFRAARILLPNAQKDDIALLTHVFPEVHDEDEGAHLSDDEEIAIAAEVQLNKQESDLQHESFQKGFSLDDEGVGSAAVDIATKGIVKNNMNRLCGLLVALISKCIEVGTNPPSAPQTPLRTPQRTSVSAISEFDSNVPPFQFLLLFEYAHLDPLSWEVINDLMAIGANRRIASPLVLQTKMTSEGSPSPHLHVHVRPLLCLVTRPLVGTSASVEYLEMIEEATAMGTMINVNPLSQTDMVLMLRHCIAKHIWKMKSKTNLDTATMSLFQLDDSDNQEDVDEDEKRTLAENVSSFYTVISQVNQLDGVSMNDIVEAVAIHPELSEFTWDYTRGCPSEVKAMCDNFFLQKMIAFSFANLNKTDDEQEDFKFTITVSLHQNDTLHVMRLSQFLRMSAISRFHSALDEKPAAWSQMARLSSCFHRTFSVHLLCELLRGMNYHEGDEDNGGLAFSEEYISKMLHSLVDCGILEVSIDENYGEESASESTTKNQQHHNEIFQFQSKLVSHALRETLLDSQLNIVISAQLQLHCKSLVTLTKKS